MPATVNRYTNVAIAFHWTIAALIIYMLFWGENLIRNVEGPQWPSLHATIGTTILILSLGRLAWRFMNPPPPGPPMPKWQEWAATFTHWAFYVFMIGLPLTGMAAFKQHLVKNPSHADAKIFGLIPVPQIDVSGFIGIHALGTKIVIGLLILHVAAALMHQFWYKDHLLRKMSPH